MPVRTAFLLLFLTAHAFVVSAAHNHRFQLGAGWPDSPHIHAGKSTAPDQGSEANNNHAQCLLCRLQRNFVAELSRHSSVAVAPSEKFSSYTVDPLSLHSSGAFFAPAGRAPPLA